MGHFDKIKKHLSRLRKWEVAIKSETDTILDFNLVSRHETKMFRVYYANMNNEQEVPSLIPRPSRHYYYCTFDQKNVIDARYQRFTDVFDYKWLEDEDEVIYWLALRKKHYA